MFDRWMMGAKQRRATMSTTHGLHAARLPLHRGSSQGSGGLLIAVALFLAVVISEAAFIALAASSIPDIGSLYITVT
jgi:hypothetical protein